MKAAVRHSTAPGLALGALAFLMLAGLLMGVRLFGDHRQLSAELATLRAAQSHGSVSIEAPASPESSSIAAEIERESALLRAAEAQAVEIGKSLPPMSHEEWRSLGRVEELGQQAADFIGSFSDFVGRVNRHEQMKEGDDAHFFQNMTGWMKRMEVIGEMEDTPEEIARLHTATLSARMKLDDATQTRGRRQIEREFSKLGAQKLTRPQRPDAEREEWYARRKTALDEATQRIEALIPATQRQQFAVGQSLHLGTGLRSKMEVLKDGRDSMTMFFDLPGIDWRF